MIGHLALSRYNRSVISHGCQRLCHPERSWRSRSECQRSRRTPAFACATTDDSGHSHQSGIAFPV